jgi:hypothetical protein
MPDDRASLDCLIIVIILAMLVAGDLLSAGAVRGWLFSVEPPRRDYVWTAPIGLAVGFAELVSRYRDEPWRVAWLWPGKIFILLNGLAACLALFILQHFASELHAPTDPVLRVALAGTGAMVVIRSKIFTVHQPGGTDVAVGPAFVLDSLLAAINRDVDRQRAMQRVALVATWAAKLAPHDYNTAHDFLLASLAAFQNMDVDVAKSLRAQLQQLVSDDTLKQQPNQVKYVIAGYSILTEFGDRTFTGVFTALEDYFRKPPAAAA